ncbi:MAG: DUF4298 domain-containing protein [Moraxella sp.]|nr:DUF4298 domain-containing protein [Moraxella sp.]
MPVSESELNKLISMQQLNDQISTYTLQMQQMMDTLQTMQQACDELTAFYTDEWIELYDQVENDLDVNTKLNAAKAKHAYSILGQDTIWNTLEEAQDTKIDLLKLLANNL